MNNIQERKERIGDIEKSDLLSWTKEFETFFANTMTDYPFEYDYDVIARELPYFKTLNYTEYANTITIHPLQLELRVTQMMDAWRDDVEVKYDYIEFFKNNIIEKNANKYKDRISTDEKEARRAIVVLPGSNKLKDRVCLNKLKYIRDTHGKDAWIKPHPLTTHKLVGELMDLFGEENVLHRNDDVYTLMAQAEIVYSSVISESAMYAIALDKQLEPIDVYHKMPEGSFYHINRFLFQEDDPKAWVNRVFNSHKSGIFCPLVDENWKEKLVNYLEYISLKRKKFKNKYL
jgi:hypothetical protein